MSTSRNLCRGEFTDEHYQNLHEVIYSNIDEKNNITQNTKLDTTKPETTKPDNNNITKNDICDNVNIISIKTNCVNSPKTSSPCLTHKKMASSRWKKISNIFRSISSLRSHDTKNIGNDREIDLDLQDYHSRLFPNSNQKKQREITEEDQNNDDDYDPNEAYDREIALFHGALISPKNQQMFKNELFDIIIQGEDNSEAINKINNILKLTDHDKNPKKGDPEYIFNKPFKNGKNLFYLACQEGKLEIVKCFLSKGFNPKLKSKVDEIGSESPLECACRWNYLKIIELLLSKVKYSESEIQNALMIDGLNKKIIVLLKKYLKEHCKKDKIFCFC